MVSHSFQQHLMQISRPGLSEPCQLQAIEQSGGGFLGCTGKLFCSRTEHLRIWVKFFSFRIHWISNQVASAEVIYMTLFPFSQAKVLSCSRQKLIKLCQRNMIFFSHFTKLSKSLGLPVLLLTCKTFHTAPGTTQDLLANPLNFLPRETVEVLLEKRMALTPSGAGRDVAHIQKCRSTGIYRDNLYFRSNLRAHRHIVCVYLCVDI